MLHPKDTTFRDSSIYQKLPKFLSYGNEKSDTILINNVKPGMYELIALEDKNGNLKFDPQSEKIAFRDFPICLPDSEQYYSLNLFQEQLPYRINSPQSKRKGLITFTFAGYPDLSFQRLSPKPDTLQDYTYYSKHCDTVDYWYEFQEEDKELSFVVQNGMKVDTLNISLRTSKPEPFRMTPKIKKLFPNTPINIEATSAIFCLDTSRISLQRKSDSAYIDCHTRVSKNKRNIYIGFANPEQDEPESYLLSFLPGAVESIFRENHDTLMFAFTTVAAKEFSTLTVGIDKQKPHPFFMELLNQTRKVVYQKYIDQPQDEVYFSYVKPGDYFLRMRYDINRNKEWDTGDFLKRRQPEPIYYYSKAVKLKTNWDVEVNWDISLPSVLNLERKKEKKS